MHRPHKSSVLVFRFSLLNAISGRRLPFRKSLDSVPAPETCCCHSVRTCHLSLPIQFFILSLLLLFLFHFIFRYESRSIKFLYNGFRVVTLGHQLSHWRFLSLSKCLLTLLIYLQFFRFFITFFFSIYSFICFCDSLIRWPLIWAFDFWNV